MRTTFFEHEDQRVVVVRRWMIDATKDDDGDANYTAALLLAQITFWCSTSSMTGSPRANHYHGDHVWLVRADHEWMTELGMTDRAVRRARNRLAKLQLIETRTLVDAGVRCTHIRRIWTADEPSTIRPETANEVSTIRPETISHPPVQAVTREESKRERTPLPHAQREGVGGPGTDHDPGFVAFWSAYPRKKDKGHARSAWRSALKRGADPASIVAAAERYRDDPARKPSFTAYASTWLNGERYDDGPDAAPGYVPMPRYDDEPSA